MIEEEKKVFDRDKYQRTAFAFCLNDKTEILYQKNRRYINIELEQYHKWKKDAQKDRNFELAGFIGKELINPHESMRKAFIITDFILLNGIGRIKSFPIELVPYIKRIECMIQYEIDWTLR